MVVFDLVDHADEGEHTFDVFSCSASGTNLTTALSDTVRQLYVESDRLRTLLRAAMEDAGAVVDVAAVNEAIDRTLTAAIPEPGTHSIAHLDVARNEVAEALAYLVFPGAYGTVVPASRIRHKEVPNQPSRGRDLLGLEEDPLTAVVGEVKASDDAASPPGVVATGDSSLRAQCLAFLQDDDSLLAELNWAVKHADPVHHGLIAKAMLAHVAGNLRLCVAPVLVRPATARGAHDFGTFKDDPSQFQPARVRFTILTIDMPLDALATAVYQEARR